MNKEKQEKIINFFKMDRFAAVNGMKLVEVDYGYARAEMRLTENHLNAANLIQGGALFTLADLALAAACNSHGQLAITLNSTISFLKGTKGKIITAVAREITEPKRISYGSVEIRDEDGNLIAEFSGTVYRKDISNPF
ncbi:MAG: PaaI family thioesterase [Peptostreptococcales bacterium]|jgi:acyl-CoA thioesterase